MSIHGLVSPNAPRFHPGAHFHERLRPIVRPSKAVVEEEEEEEDDYEPPFPGEPTPPWGSSRGSSGYEDDSTWGPSPHDHR